MNPTPLLLPGPLRHLRVEDILLFLWLILRPVILPDPHHSSANPGFDPAGGLFDLVALCGAAACLGARRRDATETGLIRDQDFAYAVGPLFGAVAFALDDCVVRLGLTGGASAIPLVLPVCVAITARLRLAPTSAPQRRALVTPFILAASGFFGGVLAGLTDLFDIRALADALAGGQLAGTLFVVAVGLVAMLLFYLMLIFAPRQIAEREGTTRTWTVRFIAFVVAISLGTTLAGIAHGT